MGWIFATVVLLLLVFIPTIRKIALVLIAVIALTIWINVENDAKKRKEKEASDAAQSAVWATQQAEIEKERLFPLSDIVLSEVKLNMDSPGRFSGRIYNKSRDKELGSLKLKLSISDCKEIDELNCVVVSERNVNLSTAVPSKQARDFMQTLDFYLNPVVIRGYMKIDTKLIGASR